MELTQQIRHDVVKSEARNHEMAIILGCSILSILLLIAIVLAWGGPETSLQDFAVIAAAP
jgi:hypothetical protein